MTFCHGKGASCNAGLKDRYVGLLFAGGALRSRDASLEEQKKSGEHPVSQDLRSAALEAKNEGKMARQENELKFFLLRNYGLSVSLKRSAPQVRRTLLKRSGL
jgi:hypothetical protein